MDLNKHTAFAAQASLRTRLTLWFGGLSLVTLLSVGFYVGRMATHEMGQTVGNGLHSTARSVAELLGTRLHERELEIVLLSQAPHFVRGDLTHPDLMLSMKRRTSLRSEYAWMGVVDSSGLVRQAVGGLLVNQSVAQRPWFQAAQVGAHTGDVHEAVLLAKVLPGNPGGEPLRFIDFAAPIHDASGKLLGVLAAHAHWRWVTETVESAFVRQGLQRDAEVLILNHKGEVLYPARLADQQRTDLPWAEGLHYATLRWADGRDYLTSVVPVDAPSAKDLGWSIVVRQPLDQALYSVHALRNQLLALGVVAAMVFALIAYWIAQRISRPIEQLARSARRIQARKPDPEFPRDPGIREIAQLGTSMQAMTQSLLDKEHALQEINTTLEATVAQRTAALTEANAELARLATRDGLTGVYNRRRFDEKLVECQQLYRRTGHPFALLIIDADHFKRINDTHGHAAGDAVLRQLAALLQHSTRGTDFVARYGGEEFVVVLPDADRMEGAVAVAEKIRASVAAADFAAIGQVTVSIGVALAAPADASPEALVERADGGLYEAKRAGRNRVVFQDPVAPAG